MEPFTITCSTCQSLIRVRNPKMIGQIVNCPKCNSMLQIEEPRQIRVESHRGVIDSSAMTKEAFAPELEDEYRLAPSDSPLTDLPLSDATRTDSALAAPPRMDTEFEANIDSHSFTAPLRTERNTVQTSSTIQALSVQRSARNRQMLMVAVLGASGVLLAGLLFTGFLLWYRGDRSQPSVAANANQTQVGLKPERQPELAPAVDAIENPLADQLEDPLQNAPDAPAADTVAPNTEANTEEIKPEDGTAIAGGDLAAALEIQDTAKLAGMDPPEAPETPAPEREPAQPVVDLPEQLKKFESILNTVIEPQLVPDEAVQKAPPTAEELGLATGVDSKAIPALDAANQLQTELSGWILPERTPIAFAVNTWVLLSGVPTVVNLDSFAAAGIDPHKSIGIKIVAPQPLSEIGLALAQQIGVDFRLIDNQFAALEASEAAIREHLPQAIEISDLVTDADQQQWLLRTLNQLSPQHTDRWRISDGQLTVDPAEVDLVTWFWAVRMLESWRQAAGLASPLKTLDQARLVTKFVDPDKLAALNQPLSLTLSQRVPAPQLLTELSAAANVQIWVDWLSVGQRGLGPSSLDLVVTQQRSMSQCLRDFAVKYGLVVACEDERALWITTNASYRAQPRIYVLPSEGKTAEQWSEELQLLTPVIAEAVQPVQAFLTPDGRFVIVRCCRPRLRT